MSATATRPVSILPTGTSVSRFIIAKALGRGDMWSELQIAERWLDCPQVKATLELRTKAAVAAGSTTDATWAAPLSAYGIAAEAITIMRGMLILGALESRMQKAPLHVRLARKPAPASWEAGSPPGPRFRCRRRPSPRSSKSISSTA